MTEKLRKKMEEKLENVSFVEGYGTYISGFTSACDLHKELIICAKIIHRSRQIKRDYPITWERFERALRDLGAIGNEDGVELRSNEGELPEEGK